VYADVADDDVEAACGCLRGYPFTCPFVPPDAVDALDDPDLLALLDGVCRTCPNRLDSERCHRRFAV
jgi:hypothetical protein